MVEFTMQIDTTAEFTHALNEESKEPSNAKKSQTVQRVRTYRQRHADGDHDSDAEDMVPDSKRNKTEGMNLNNALKQARKKMKQGEELTLFELRIIQDEKARKKGEYRTKLKAELLGKPINQTSVTSLQQIEQLQQEMAQIKAEKTQLEKKLQLTQEKVDKQDEMLKYCLKFAEIKRECDVYRYCVKWKPKTTELYDPQLKELVHLSNRHQWLDRNGKVGVKTTEADRLKDKSVALHKKEF